MAAFLDLTIAGGPGGKEVAAEIRRVDQGLPLFVTSGYSDDPIVARPEKYGFTASLPKPYRHRELLELLQSYVPGGLNA